MAFLKRRALYTPALAFLLLLAACGNTPGDPQRPAVEGNPAFAALNDSISKYPQDAALYLRRANRLTAINAHDLASADFKKAWSLEPSVETALPYAANLRILGKDSERLALLRTGSEKFPANAQLQRLLGDAYSGNGNQDMALQQYRKMLNGDPNDFETWYEMGLLQEQLKDTAGAIGSLQKAYGLQKVATYGLELAHLYAEQKNALSLEICNDILRQDSASLLIDPLFIKGIYYSNTKQYPKAIAQFDSCIQRDWKTTDAYLEKGIAWYRLQNYPAAISTFKMATTVSNTDPDAYYWLGRCYEATQNKNEAISNYQKAFALDKTFTDAKDAIEKLQSGFGDPSH
jgi:tetratricopeptide (TPR) repeat protein